MVSARLRRKVEKRRARRAKEEAREDARSNYSNLSEKIHNGLAWAGSAAATAGAGLLGLTVAGATGGLIGAALPLAALGVQYVRADPGRNAFPYTEIEEPEYQATQWFTGHRGPVLGGEATGTRWFLKPLLRRVTVGDDDESELERITAVRSGMDLGKFNVRSKDLFEAEMDGRYNYMIPTKKDAFKFFWRAKRQERKDNIDRLIESAIQNEVAKIYANPDDPRIDSEDQRRIEDSSTYEHNILGVLNYGINKAEKDPEKLEKSVYHQYGVKITAIPLNEPNFDDESQSNLQIIAKSHADARAIRNRAKAHAEANITLAEGTRQASATLLETAREYTASGRSDQREGDVALQLADMVNNERVSERQGTIVKVSGLLSRLFNGGGAQPNVFQNYGPITRGDDGEGFSPQTAT